MQNQEVIDKTKKALEVFVGGLGYEIVELRLFRACGKLILRLLVDRPSAGISLKECAVLNEQIGGFLDRENIIETAYTLEVSSPGADRELLTEKDFSRVVGRRVRVFLKEPLGRNLELEADITGVRDNALFLDTGSKIERIPINKINKAKQVIE